MSKSNFLDESSGYNKLISYYEKYQNKPFDYWLEFDKTLKPGKQGIVGLLNLKKKSGSSEELQYIFKFSQYINYLIQHEGVVMKGLREISNFCPNFCKYVGTIICKVDPKSKKEGDPFNPEAKYPIEKEVLLCELIEKSTKFYNYIKADDRIKEDILYSTIKQVLLAIAIAQRKKNFTHYDLHSNNIMMKKCNKDLVFLYILDEYNQFVVPSFGHYPVIIDFGFSYIDDLNDGPLWPSMGHTDAGFMSDRFDWVADPKLFLITVSDEIKGKRNTKKSKKLRRIVRNIFQPLKIDWDNGWDNVEKKSAADYVTGILSGYNGKSKLFKEYDYYCIDILQSLIILPLEKQCYKEIEISYSSFMKEWVKIENEVSSPFYNLYILKSIVDAARCVRSSYINSQTSIMAVKDFSMLVKNKIDEVAKFCTLKTLNYEKLLCSLYVLSRNIEGILYDIIDSRFTEKEKEYKKLPLQSIEQIYGSIECNIKDDYVYNTNTNVFIINSINNECGIYKIPKDKIESINNMNQMTRGTFIYDLYKS